MIREAIDSWDDAEDRVDTHTFDLFGNRVASVKDWLSTVPIDEAIRYLYDDNDRLVSMSTDTLADGVIDQLVEYTGRHPTDDGDHQASRRNGSPGGAAQNVRYDLQGKLNHVESETRDATGVTTVGSATMEL